MDVWSFRCLQIVGRIGCGNYVYKLALNKPIY